MNVFQVKTATKFYDPTSELLIANYLPGHTYRITDLNRDFVAAQVEAGNAQTAGILGTVSGTAESSVAAQGGTVSDPAEGGGKTGGKKA